LNSTETALADQQREVTTADIQLFRHLRDHAEKEMEGGSEENPVTNFLKKNFICKLIY
jgi:hypothetical protein